MNQSPYDSFDLVNGEVVPLAGANASSISPVAAPAAKPSRLLTGETTPQPVNPASADDPVSAITAVAQEYGVNPHFLLGLAQLETRGGKATVKGQGVDSRNLFNIKDFSKAGTGIRALDKAEGSNDPYRRYDSASDSARDLVRLLGSKRYEGALTAQTPEEFAAALKRGGYATDPEYVRKLSSTIRGVQAKNGVAAGNPAKTGEAYDWMFNTPDDQLLQSIGMGGSPQIVRPKAQVQAPENPGFFRGAGDVGLSFLQGAAGSVKSLTDLAGAGNAVSRVLDDTSKELGKLKSEEAQQSLAYHQKKIKDAETNGDWKQEIGAYYDMVWDMPGDSLAQALGSLITLGAGKTAQALKLALSARKAGMTKEAFLKTVQGVEAAKKASNLGAGVNLGLGVGQGVGGVKGEQYERTYNAAKEEGLADDEAQALATEAQSYGKGWMQQAAGAALGYAAAKTGPLEKLASGQTVGAGGVLRRFAGGAAIESASEGGQGGQARYAGNAAAIDAGVLDESQRFAGVAGTAFSEGLLGGVVGGGAGALGRPDVDPLATTKEAAKKPNSPISRAAVAGQPAKPEQPSAQAQEADPTFAGMSDSVLLQLQRSLQEREAAGDEDITDDEIELAQAAKAEYDRRMAAKPPPPPGLGYNPDPLIVFPDGTAGRKGDMERYVASLPEEKRNEARAKLYGYAPQPTNSPPPAAPAQPAGVSASGEPQPVQRKPAATIPVRAPSPFDAVPMEQDPAITQQQREDAAKAQERRSKRMASLRLGAYNKNPMMEFLGRHGLQPETQNEFAPGTTERRKASVYGYGPVFRQNGKPLDLLLSNAQDEGFLPPEASESDLYDLVARAINGERVEPLYKAGSADDLMQRLAAEREAKEAASYEDFLAQQQALAADPDYDPFATFADTENDYDVSDLDSSGYSQAERSLQAEVSALAQAYSQLGFDADDVLEPLASQYESNPDEYYAQARQRLTQLIAQATQPRGNDNLPQDSGEQAQAPIGREAANATSADDDALIDYAIEDDGEPDHFLQAQTARQLREREDAIAEQTRLNAERQQALEAKAQADDERKRIEQASVQAADTFELGQNALDNLTGQTDLLAQMPTAQAESPAPAATQPTAQPQDGDILSDNGKPFTFEYGAKLRAKKDGGEVVQVAGGYVVRPTQGEAMQADPVAGDKIDDEWTAFSAQSGTLGIPRAEMPQVKAQDRGAMVNFLKARGIDSSNEVMPARAIKPTQAEFSPAKVQEAANRQDGNRSIIVSADGYVVDGHHQWMAQRQKGEPVKVIKLDQPIGDVLQALKEMPSAQPEQAQDATLANGGYVPAPPEFASFEAKTSLLGGNPDLVDSNGDLGLNERGEKIARTPWDKLSQQDRAMIIGLSDSRRASSDAYNAKVREQEFQAERRRLQGDRIIQQANGKPFKKEANAQAKLDEFDLADTHAIQQVDGGFVLRQMPPAEQAERQRKAEGRESYTQAQAAVLAEMGIGESADGEIDATEAQWDEIHRRVDQRLKQKLPAPNPKPSQPPARTAKQRRDDAVQTLQETRNSIDALLAMYGDGLDPADDVIEVIQRAASGFDASEKKKLNRFIKEFTKPGKSGTYITNERQFFDLLPEQFGAAQWLLSDAINDLANESPNQPPPRTQQEPKIKKSDAKALFSGKAMDRTRKAVPADARAMEQFIADGKEAEFQRLLSIRQTGRDNLTDEETNQFYDLRTERNQAKAAVENAGYDRVKPNQPLAQQTPAQAATENVAQPQSDEEQVAAALEYADKLGLTGQERKDAIVSELAFSWDMFKDEVAELDVVKAALRKKPSRAAKEARADQIVKDVMRQALAANRAMEDAINADDAALTQPTIDTSAEAKWRNNWGEAKRTAESLGLPVKDGKRNLKLTEMVPAIEAKLAQQDNGKQDAGPIDVQATMQGAVSVDKLSREDFDKVAGIFGIGGSGKPQPNTAQDQNAKNYAWIEKETGYAPIRPNGKPYILKTGVGKNEPIATSFGAKPSINDTVRYFATEEDAANWGRENGYAVGGNPYAKKPSQPAIDRAAEVKSQQIRQRIQEIPDRWASAEKFKIAENKRNLATRPPGWYVFDENKYATQSGPYRTKRDAEKSRDTMVREWAKRKTLEAELESIAPQLQPSTPLARAEAELADWKARRNLPANAGNVADVDKEINRLEQTVAALKKIEQGDLAQNPLMQAAQDSGKLVMATVGDKKQPTQTASKLDAAAAALDAEIEAAGAELAALFKRKSGQLNSGVDPEILMAGAKLGALYTAKGVVKFAQWARAIVSHMQRLGVDPDMVKPALKEIYAATAQRVDDATFDLMDDARAVRGFDLSTLDAQPDGANEALREIDNAGQIETKGEQDDAGTAIYEDGARPLGAVAAQDGAGAAGTGSTELRGPDGQQEGGAAGGGADDAGVSKARGRGDRPARADSAAPRAGVGTKQAKRQEKLAREAEQAPELHLDASQQIEAASPINTPALDFVIDDSLELGKGSETVKFRDNLEAIRTLKKIEAENRRASPDEQRILARYVGWGGLKNAFRVAGSKDGEGVAKGWEARVAEVEELLTPAELRAARNSTTAAHYTSETVVKGVWKAVQRLGFRGGSVLEPSMGSGNFLGLMPQAVRGTSRVVGVEYDSLTARMAQHLYPNATVLHSGYQELPMPTNQFALAIGNPPFGKESLYFRSNPAVTGMSIHNQFFVASLDALAPDGIMGMVVSRYLMDSQNNAARLAMAERAEFLGAIRLPDTAFQENARTEVVTDILFFRKRSAGEVELAKVAIDVIKQGGIAKTDVEKAAAQEAQRIAAWTTSEKVANFANSGEDIGVNRYFMRNPGMVVGRMDASGTMQARAGLNVKLDDPSTLPDRLDAAIQLLPEFPPKNTVQERTAKSFEVMATSLRLAVRHAEPGGITLTPEGRLKLVVDMDGGEEMGKSVLSEVTLDETTPYNSDYMLTPQGKWQRQTDKVGPDGKPVKVVNKYGKVTNRNEKEVVVFERTADIPVKDQWGAERIAMVRAMLPIRDLMKNQLMLESTDAPPGMMRVNRKRLNDAYDAFVKAHGPLHGSKSQNVAMTMPDGALALAAESARYDGKKMVGYAKADILQRRVVEPPKPVESVESIADAVAVSLGETGTIDIDRIAKLMGTDAGGAEQLLSEGDSPRAFFDPELQRWESADSYLSGLVRRKLLAARAAGLDGNVRALEKVQPQDWDASQITPNLGSAWIPSAVYADFLRHLGYSKSSVSYSALTNSFTVSTGGKSSPQWAVASSSLEASEIAERTMNSKPVKVTYLDENKKERVDEEATAEAQMKAREIFNEFQDWAYADTDRREQLVRIFNEKYNTRVTRQRDGSHLKLPGKVPDTVIKMRRHQMNAIWRGITDRSVLYDHVVGAGKTFTAIARIMERRRMGLSRKPMVVVPNHLVEQWANDVLKLYPGANVLAAGKADFEKSNRRRLFARIASGDYDMVIMGHSSFGFISLDPSTEERYLDDELRAAVAAVKEAEEVAREEGYSGFRKPFGVAEAERLVKRITERMDKLRDGKRDRLLTFEEMGVDDLTIDESHEFKNLAYSSRLSKVAGMGNKTGSSKATDLHLKIRSLNDRAGTSVAFLTGTPISNSVSEMFLILKNLTPKELKEMGMDNFDAWRTLYASVGTAYEPTESGSLKEVTRLGREWTNMRSLMDLYYSVSDAVTMDDIKAAYAEENPGSKFPIPEVRSAVEGNGDREMVVIKPTPEQRVLLRDVVSGFNGLPFIQDPKDRNKERLRLMDRARKVSLDVRAVDPRAQVEDPTAGKIGAVVKNVARIYRQWDADRGTQIVFLDRSVPSAKGDDKKVKDYDALVQRRTQAINDGNDAEASRIEDELEKFNASEIEELRNALAGGWNAYAEIKRQLVAQGVPENEIRFVQEANTDDQKMALFGLVKSGKVRVLIGSTPRMGAGTNVQDRLVALHHVDVTWKPSDIEQREGRIVRQGNLFATPTIDGKPNPMYRPGFAVDVMAYATEMTVDAKMWSLNATKLKAINGVRKYDGAFNMEFEDEESASMAEMAALATGNPLMIERVVLDGDIKKLEMAQRSFNRRIGAMRDRLSKAVSAINNNPQAIADSRAFAQEVQYGQDRAMERILERSITVQGKTYRSKQSAQEAMQAEIAAIRGDNEKARFSIEVDGENLTSMDAINNAINDAFGHPEMDVQVDGVTHANTYNAGKAIFEKTKGLGDTYTIDGIVVNGVAVEIDVQPFSREYVAEFVALDRNGKEMASYRNYIKGPLSAQLARNGLEDLKERLNPEAHIQHAKYLSDKMDKAKAEVGELERLAAETFPQAEELQAKRARLNEVVSVLSAQSEASRREAKNDDAPVENGFERQVRYSRNARTAAGLPTAQVEAVVRQLQSGWSNAPAVVVAQDLQDPRVPQAVRDENARQVTAGAEGAPEGFIHGETVYLVASQMGSPADAARVLLHETLGHYGLRGVFGDALSPILRDLASKRRREVVEMAVRYGLVPDTVASNASVATIYQAMTPAQREQAAEEVLAYMAQNQPELGFVRRAIAAIRQWLKSTFPTLGERLALTDGDIVANYILPARAFVESGRPRVQAHRTAKAQSNLMDVLAALDESGVVDINC